MRMVLVFILCFFAASAGMAEIFFPPKNVVDPSRPEGTLDHGVDQALAFVYFEPHDVCFDMRDAILVTAYLVNRSQKNMHANISQVMENVRLRPAGGAPVARRNARPSDKAGGAVIKPTSFTKHTFDLGKLFKFCWTRRPASKARSRPKPCGA